jgi:hypothetical protein
VKNREVLMHPDLRGLLWIARVALVLGVLGWAALLAHTKKLQNPEDQVVLIMLM